MKSFIEDYKEIIGFTIMTIVLVFFFNFLAENGDFTQDNAALDECVKQKSCTQECKLLLSKLPNRSKGPVKVVIDGNGCLDVVMTENSK